jgi:hypothetical protein
VTRRYTVREVVYTGPDGTAVGGRALAWLIYLSPSGGAPDDLYVLRLSARPGALPAPYVRGAEVSLDPRLLSSPEPPPRAAGTPEGVV